MAEKLSDTEIVPIAQNIIVPDVEPLDQNSIVPIAEALAQKLGFSLSENDTVKEAGALLAFEAIKSATEALFPTVAAGMIFNGTGFTLAKIQKKLDEISKRIDVLLEKDYKSAVDFLGDGIRSFEHHDFEESHKDFKKVLDKATDAYNCAQNNDLKLIQSSKMKIFCYIVTKSYDKDSKHFIPYESLLQKKKDLIASLVRTQIEKLLNDLTTVKHRSDVSKFFKTILSKQEEIDNVMEELNGCLKSGTILIIDTISTLLP